MSTHGQDGKYGAGVIGFQVMQRWLSLVATMSVIVGGVGCRVDRSLKLEEEPAATEAVVDPSSLVIRVALGNPVAFKELVDVGVSADVLVVGEIHGNVAGRAWTRAFWEAVREERDDAVLSLEFLERDQQRALDDAWLMGNDWPVKKSMGFAFPLVSESRVIASNAPRRYVSAYRKQGSFFVGRMTPEQRRLVVVPEDVGLLTDGNYWSNFKTAMNSAKVGHSNEPIREVDLVAFYRAQLMWDATMADSIVKALDQNYRPVVHVVGRFHSDHEGGLVRYLKRFRPGVEVVTVSLVDAEPPTFNLWAADMGRADYVVYLQPPSDGDRASKAGE